MASAGSHLLLSMVQVGGGLDVPRRHGRAHGTGARNRLAEGGQNAPSRGVTKALSNFPNMEGQISGLRTRFRLFCGVTKPTGYFTRFCPKSCECFNVQVRVHTFAPVFRGFRQLPA